MTAVVVVSNAISNYDLEMSFWQLI